MRKIVLAQVNLFTENIARTFWKDVQPIFCTGPFRRPFFATILVFFVGISPNSYATKYRIDGISDVANPGLKAANIPPVIAATEATALSYAEGQAATNITPLSTVTDADNPMLTGATITITTNYINGEDVLSFVSASGITGSFDATTGTLTLTGSSSVANYQTALRNVKYQNTNNNMPSVLARTIQFSVTDGTDVSNLTTRNINVTGVNDASVLSGIEATALAFTEGDAATAVTASINVADVDNTTLASATLQITTNYQNGQDVLAFTNAFGITGTFTAGTGTLLLSGVASVSDYQAAIQSVTYINTNVNNPSTVTRTLSFRVNDGATNSNTVTRSITVAAVNDAPILAAIELAALNYAEGAAATSVTSSMTAVDVDNANLTGATVQITTNFVDTEDVLTFTTVSGITGTYDAITGTMTLTGSASVGNYQNALRTVRYQNTNGAQPSSLQRTVSYTVTDGLLSSNTASRNINVTQVNDAPVVAGIEMTQLAYTEGDAATIITATTTMTDVDNTTLASATVQITTNYQNGQDILAFANTASITGTFTAATGLLTLTGVATLADYQAALQSVTYRNSNNNNPSALNRTVSIRVNDGATNSNTVTRVITVAPVNDAPVLAATELTNLAYSEGQAATAVSTATTVTDVDNANLTGATVQITGNYLSTEDVLAFTNAFGITGSYDAGTGTMTLSGTTTFGNYQSAIRAVTFRNTNNANPSGLVRTVSYQVTDGALASNIVSRNITFTPVNDLSVLAGIEAATLPYTEGQAATVISSSTTITDVDNTTLASATVQITGNYQNGQDVLAFAPMAGITATFTAASGLLTLSGAASVSDYQAALQSVTYENTNNANPSALLRTVTFRVNDGVGNSNTQTRTITITVVNDAPVLAAIETTDLAYAEGQAATSVTATMTATDGDNANLTGATIQITGNFISSEDVLSFANAGGITGSYNATTGTMTLTGNVAVATYQAQLRNVRYRNTNNATPSPLTRTVSYTITDGALVSNTATRNIAVTPVNDPPTVVNDPVTTPEEVAIIINVLANDSDMDDTIDPTTVTIITQPLAGTTSVNPSTGEVTYTPNNNFSGVNTFTYTVKDLAGGTSNPATVTVTVTNINDAPTFTGGTDQVVNEDAGVVTVPGWATAMDDGDPFTTQSLTFLTSNTNNALFATQPTINVSGTLSFKPANNASGVATVTVTLRDNGLATPPPNVNLSAAQTFVITVLSVNDAPVGVDDFYSTSSNTSLSANAKVNDTDLEGNATTLSPTPLVPPAFGTVVITSGGTFTYTPDGSFTGTDTFTYQICDNGTDNGVAASRCGQGVVSITVNPVNSNYNIVGNNSIELSPDCFILTKALNNQQGAVWNRTPLDLRYSFELNFVADFSEPGVIRDTGADGIMFALQRDSTPPPLNVQGLPIDARGSVGEYLGIGGVTPSIGIEVDTYQNAGEPTYDHIAISKNGSVYDIVSAAVPAKLDGSNAPVNIEDGMDHTVQITWDKPTNTLKVFFDGVDRGTFTQDIINTIFSGDPKNIFWGFSSSTGGQNNYQSVCGITMNIINLPPVAGTDNPNVDEDAPLSGTVSINDNDPEGGTLTVTAETKATPHGTVTINADGTYVYTPTGDYNGTDVFTYTICDSFTPAGCSTGTVTISIAPTSDNPVAVTDVYTINEDIALNPAAGLLSNDSDADGDLLTAIIGSSPTHGTLVLNSNGTFTYTPDADYNGTDSFTYTANDGANNSALTTVSLTISPVNDAPVAVNDALSTNEDVAAIVNVLTNDHDVDDAINTATVVITAPPLHGATAVNPATGVITYTPDTNYFGSDTFSYTVNDQSGAVSNVATVTVTVVSVNDVPVAVADAATTLEDNAVTIDVLVNDSDVDNAIDVSSVSVTGSPSHGTTSVDNSGVVTYTPDADYAGNDSFVYTVKDISGGTSNAATVTITVTPENDAPVAEDDNVTTIEEILVNISILTNDHDPDNTLDPASINIVSPALHGTMAVNTGTGVVSYTSEPGFLGTDSFTYTISDGLLTSNVATVSILVKPANRAPDAVDDGPIDHGSVLPLTIDVLANDSDVDNTNSELTIVSVTQPQFGSVSIVDGRIVFQPSGTESGMITFTYTISDPEGLTDMATVTINYEYMPLTVSQGFSPNNQGNNEFWYIRSIESFPNNSVKVFDRWGLLVYQAAHYDNATTMWNGRANTGQESGKLVEQGTYYYTLDLGNNSKVLSGYVMIVR